MARIMLRRTRTGSVPSARRPSSSLRSRESELVQQLGTLPVFAGCEPSDLVALVRTGGVVTLPARWTFVHEGTPADACYVLLEGQVRVLVHGVERAVLGPGCLLGEMSLLSGRLRQADLVTGTPIQALRVPHDALAFLLRTHPRLEASVSAALREHQAADERFTHRDVQVDDQPPR